MIDHMSGFDWWAIFEANHPGWQIRFRLLDVDEIICWRTSTITLALWLPDPLFRVSHGIAHISRHQGARGRPFTDAEEDEADEVARFWKIIMNDEQQKVQ